MILISCPRLVARPIHDQIISLTIQRRMDVPFHSLILHLRDLILNELQYLIEHLGLNSFVPREAIRILFDLCHQIIETHEPESVQGESSPFPRVWSLFIPKVLVRRLHLRYKGSDIRLKGMCHPKTHGCSLSQQGCSSSTSWS